MPLSRRKRRVRIEFNILISVLGSLLLESANLHAQIPAHIDEYRDGKSFYYTEALVDPIAESGVMSDENNGN